MYLHGVSSVELKIATDGNWVFFSRVEEWLSTRTSINSGGGGLLDPKRVELCFGAFWLHQRPGRAR